MIYINFIEFYCLMLHAKFQNHRPSGSGGDDIREVFTIYGLACDLDFAIKLS